MPHGYPDWGFATTDFSFIDNDLSEIAARLGGIYNYGFSGKVLYIDDFSHSFNAWKMTNGNGHTQIIASNEAGELYEGCLKITSDVAFPPAMAMQRYMPGLPRTRMGVDLTLAHNLVGLTLIVLLDFYVDQLRYNSALKYVYNTGVVSVLDSDNIYKQIGLANIILPNERQFNLFKMVVDFEDVVYGTVRINGVTFDASAFHPRVSATGIENNYIDLSIDISTGVNNATVYVGHVAITRSEP